MLHLGASRRQLERVFGRERRVVHPDHRPAALLEAGELAQLPQSQRGLDVGHVVLEAGHHDVVVPVSALVVALPGITAHAVQAHDAGAIEKRGLAREHPALGGREVLGRVEAEGHGVGAGADETAPVAGRHGVRGVLDHREPMRRRQLTDAVEVGRVAGVVHGENGAGARRDRRGDERGIDVQGVRLHVHQDGPGAHVLDHVDGGRERRGRRDHLVARTDAQGHQRGVQARGARVHRQRAGRADVGGELLLESLGLRPGRDPARPQGVDDLGDLLLADERRRERQEVPPWRWRGNRSGRSCRTGRHAVHVVSAPPDKAGCMHAAARAGGFAVEGVTLRAVERRAPRCRARVTTPLALCDAAPRCDPLYGRGSPLRARY